MQTNNLPFRIGPNPVVFLSFPLVSLSIVLATLNLLFLHVTPVRIWLYGLLESIRVGDLLISYYEFNLSIHGTWLCLLIMLLGAAIGFIAYKTSSYTIRESGGDLILSLKFGFFVKGGPRSSYFTVSTDDRIIALVSNCDPSRSIMETVCGMGTLHLESANEQNIDIPYVQNPEAAAKFIMDNSKVPDSRVYSST